MPKARYVLGEAWSIARSGPRQTAMAVLLVALSLYVPGLLVLLAGNVARVTGSGEGAPAVVVTLEESADAKAVAERLGADARVARATIVDSAAALERFRRAYPDLGAALSELKEAPFPTTLEVGLKPSASSGLRRADRDGCPRLAGCRGGGIRGGVRPPVFRRRAPAAGSGPVPRLRSGRRRGSLGGLGDPARSRPAPRRNRDHAPDGGDRVRHPGAVLAARLGRGPRRRAACARSALRNLPGRDAVLAISPHPVLAQFWSAFLDGPTSAAIPLLGITAGFLGSLLSLGEEVGRGLASARHPALPVAGRSPPNP